MKIISYFGILFALFIIYLWVIVIDAPTASTVITTIGSITLGLLFYEIYKKYSFSPRSKYVLVSLIIFWAVLVISQIEYIPSKEILVKDVFGKPLTDISITIVDNVGSEIGGHGSSVYRVPKVFHYITDGQGKAETKPRFYFGQRKAEATYAGINGDVYKPGSDYRDEDIIKRNNLELDSKSLSLHYEDKFEVYLSPIKIDYRKCDSISDLKGKSECLVFGLFYSAVKENNYHLCELYNNEGVNQALGGSSKFYLNRPHELKYECMMLVEGILNNNPKICGDIEDKETRYFNQQCQCVFGNSCYEDYYDEEFQELRPMWSKNTHNYLCEEDKTNSPYSNFYKNDSIRYLDTASELYREMFCQ